MLSFASDNHAGAHPEVLEALTAANRGHEGSYGQDSYTRRLEDLVREHFDPRASVYPVFNGTGANVVALQGMQPLWGGIICSATAHINTDEGGAPEHAAGLKLLPVATEDGKLTPALLRAAVRDVGNVHHAQATTLSVTQATEVGTVYSIAELTALTDTGHSLGLSVHVDGARLANAAAALGVSLRALTAEAGVDVVSFGGTKNGLLFGELIIVINERFTEAMGYVRKFDMQLASKMRYLSAQFIALLEDDLWYRSAQHANEMAALLREEVEGVRGVRITHPTQVNSVFAILPPGVEAILRSSATFQSWDAARREVRWMCAHDTTPSDVHRFAAVVRSVAEGDRASAATA